MRKRIQFADVIIVLEHNWGTIEIPLEHWIDKGPGERDLLSPFGAYNKWTGERLPFVSYPIAL